MRTTDPPPGSRAPVRLYAAHLALLTTHQVDAAHWREWEVFGAPGGLPFFLAFHLGAVGLLTAGLVQVAEGGRSARGHAILCAAVGLFTVAIHAIFLAIDRTAFWAPASLGILLAILAAALGQLRWLPEARSARAP